MERLTPSRSARRSFLALGLAVAVIALVGCTLDDSRKDEETRPPRVSAPSSPFSDATNQGDPADLSIEPTMVGEPDKPALGSMENPIKADDAAGQLAYLRRLRTSDGRKPIAVRQGTFGRGPHGNFLDGWKLIDPVTDKETLVFMDLYHPGYVEHRPIAGFELVPDQTQAER